MLKDYAFGLDTHVSHLDYLGFLAGEKKLQGMCGGCSRNFRCGVEDLVGAKA